mmetsp:Transcript_88505/g.250599  ORF Transcript_88505/g.250599 Transcript_88505/m.250599 type:complete len:391 (+) Transcript_88505:374-1546(+)
MRNYIPRARAHPVASRCDAVQLLIAAQHGRSYWPGLGEALEKNVGTQDEACQDGQGYHSGVDHALSTVGARSVMLVFSSVRGAEELHVANVLDGSRGIRNGASDLVCPDGVVQVLQSGSLDNRSALLGIVGVGQTHHVLHGGGLCLLCQAAHFCPLAVQDLLRLAHGLAHCRARCGRTARRLHDVPHAGVLHGAGDLLPALGDLGGGILDPAPLQARDRPRHAPGGGLAHFPEDAAEGLLHGMAAAGGGLLGQLRGQRRGRRRLRGPCGAAAHSHGDRWQGHRGALRRAPGGVHGPGGVRARERLAGVPHQPLGVLRRLLNALLNGVGHLGGVLADGFDRLPEVPDAEALSEGSPDGEHADEAASEHFQTARCCHVAEVHNFESAKRKSA